VIDDFLEEAAAELEAEKKTAWRKKEKWLQIIGITNDDLRNGSDYIEKLKYPPWDKRNNSIKEIPSRDGYLIGYGKYAQKTFEWVKENDSRYFEWMVSNVDKFRTKAKQLNLL
jgi:hypothetical protein